MRRVGQWVTAGAAAGAYCGLRASGSVRAVRALRALPLRLWLRLRPGESAAGTTVELRRRRRLRASKLWMEGGALQSKLNERGGEKEGIRCVGGAPPAGTLGG